MIDWLRKEVSDPEVAVGEVKLPLAIRRHATAKRMTMRLAPDGSEVRVTLPRWGRTAEALAFAESRADWLARQLGKIPQTSELKSGGTFQFLGEDVTIDWQADAPRKPVIADKVVTLGGPESSLVTRIQRWLEAEALALMQTDLSEYCEAASVTAPKLRLSRAQRRWGSCASDGTVRINWRLVQAPPLVRRSVVAHEVAHLVHFDHSPAFHALLGQIYDNDIEIANAWLKVYGRGLYASFG
ncbi:SprT family zinc-dependent metalloprotease [Altererythrobacter sp. ZODW24]|uniref:M48 family metallopeptidase n=1 Tax=Altererythrobacter sp. ZODW24 TaxID=2185142 RepID=UPI000DF7D5A0|nr:SprT family zinc-dependent metalloprotease [Altererythrobacter sp. ZODW24]